MGKKRHFITEYKVLQESALYSVKPKVVENKSQTVRGLSEKWKTYKLEITVLPHSQTKRLIQQHQESIFFPHFKPSKG